MPSLSIYLDECVDHRLVSRLRQRGFSVSTAQAEGLLGADDARQLGFAAERGLLILSHNKRHFQRWHARFREQGRSHAGILLVPSGSLEVLELRCAMSLAWIATQQDCRDTLFLWGELQRELAGGRRLAGFEEADVRLVLGR